MNELEIYWKIKKEFDIVLSKVKIVKLFFLMWIIVATGVLMLLGSVPVLAHLITWILFLTWFVFLIITINGEYKLAKKFPLFYGKWKNEGVFIETLNVRIIQCTQENDSYIKIKNVGLKYLDDILRMYNNDNQKIANHLYNTLDESNLIEEIHFYKKVKKFTMDMEKYRIF